MESYVSLAAICLCIVLLVRQQSLLGRIARLESRLIRAEDWIRQTSDWLASAWQRVGPKLDTADTQAMEERLSVAENLVGQPVARQRMEIPPEAADALIDDVVARQDQQEQADMAASDLHETPPETPAEARPNPWGESAPLQPDIWHRKGEPVPVEAAETAAPAPVRPGMGDRLAALRPYLNVKNLLLAIGSLSLAFAGLFLVRYSIEHGVLSEKWRCILAAVMGLAFIGGSFWAGRKDTKLAEVFAGAGVVILYGAVYAANGLYGLIPSSLAFLAQIAITVTGLALALCYGRRIAWLGLVGGYVAPLLISSADPQIWPVMAYVSLLTMGLVWLARDRGWVELIPLAAAGLFGWQSIALMTAQGNPLATLAPIALSSLVLGYVWSGLHHMRKAWPKRLKGAHMGALFISWFALLIALSAMSRLDYSLAALLWLAFVTAAGLFGLRLFPKATDVAATVTAMIWLVALGAWTFLAKDARLPFDYAACILVPGLPIILRVTSHGMAWARVWRMISMLYVPAAVALATIGGGWLISNGLSLDEQMIAALLLPLLAALHLPVPDLRDEDLAGDEGMRRLYRVTATFWPLMPAGWLMVMFAAAPPLWPLHLTAFALPGLMAWLTRGRTDKTLHALIAAGAILMPATLAPWLWNSATGLADFALWVLMLTPALLALSTRRGWVPPVVDGLAPGAAIIGYIGARLAGWPMQLGEGLAVLLDGSFVILSTIVLMRGVALKSQEVRSVVIMFAGFLALGNMLFGTYPPIALLGVIGIMLGLLWYYAHIGRLVIGPLGMAVGTFMAYWLYAEMQLSPAAAPYSMGALMAVAWTLASLWRVMRADSDQHWALAAVLPAHVVLWLSWAMDALWVSTVLWLLSGLALMTACLIALFRRIPQGARDVSDDRAASILALGAVLAFLFCGVAIGAETMLSVTLAAGGAFALLGYGRMKIRWLDLAAAGLFVLAAWHGYLQLSPVFRSMGSSSLIPLETLRQAALPLFLMGAALLGVWRMGRGNEAVPLALAGAGIVATGLVVMTGGYELNGALFANYQRSNGWTGWGIGTVGLILSILTLTAHALFAKRADSPLRGAVMVLAGFAAAWVIGIGLGLRNPVVHNISVGEWPLLNATLLLALAPALLGAVLTRSLIKRQGEGANSTRLAAVSACVLGAIWVALVVRQAFHGDRLIITTPPGDNEYLATAIGLTGYAALLLLLGFTRAVRLLRWLGLATLLITFGIIVWLALTRLEPVYVAIAFIVMGGVVFAGYWAYKKIESRMGEEV